MTWLEPTLTEIQTGMVRETESLDELDDFRSVPRHPQDPLAAPSLVRSGTFPGTTRAWVLLGMLFLLAFRSAADLNYTYILRSRVRSSRPGQNTGQRWRMLSRWSSAASPRILTRSRVRCRGASQPKGSCERFCDRFYLEIALVCTRYAEFRSKQTILPHSPDTSRAASIA